MIKDVIMDFDHIVSIGIAVSLFFCAIGIVIVRKYDIRGHFDTHGRWIDINKSLILGVLCVLIVMFIVVF